MSLLDGYEGLIVDLDGTVFRLEEPIEPAIEFLRRVALPTAFVTNNSTRKAGTWAEMLADAGVEVEEERVVTSAMAVAAMLSDDSPRVYAIGEEGLMAALADKGIQTTDNYEDAEAVVVGWDRRLTWDKLRTATLAIHHGARFIATNRDPVYPTDEGPWPGNGAALAAICEATNATPEVAGKPETPMFELAAERLGGGRVLVVGDQISSDIRTAQRLGWDSALAMTGVSTWQSLVGSVAIPTWVVSDLGELDGPRATRVRAGDPEDLSRLHELVGRLGREVDPPLESSTGICIAEDPDGELVAAVGWEELEQGVVVRLIIHDGQREDAAAHVLARALDSLARNEVSSIYRLGQSNEDLFAQLGFKRLSIDEAPEGLREGAEADGSLLARRFEREASER